MKHISFTKHILPHLIAVLAFVLLTVIFFNPVFLENKVITQQDILQWQGGAQELEEYREKTGEEGLWTNSMFSGMPGYLVSLKFSGEVIAYAHSIYVLGIPHPVNAIFAALLSFYILLLVFGVRPYLAIGGAIAFAFSSFNIIGLEAGHNAKIAAIAFTPLILAGIHLAFRKKYFLGASLTALSMAMHLRVNHLQITYYLLFIVLIYGVVMLIFAFKEKQLAGFFKALAFLIIAVILSVGANLGRILTLYEYSPHSIRGKSELTTADQGSQSGGLDRDYAFNWSGGVMESMTLFIPNFYGGATQEDIGTDSNLGEALKNNGAPPVQVKQMTERAPTYWGNQPSTAGPYYAGAIVIFLFIVGIILADKRYTYWLVIASVLSLMLSWGKNFDSFNYFMFDYFPGYNKFRSVTMALYIAFLCMPLLGFIGLERLLKEGLIKKNQKALFLSGGITAGIALLAFVFAGMGSFNGAVDAHLSGYPGWYLSALKADREAMMRGDAFRSLLFVILAFGIIWFYLKGKLKGNVAAIGIVLLITIDLWSVDKRYLVAEDFKRLSREAFFSPSPADERILQDESISYRVLNLQDPFNDARTSYFHKSLGGYHGAKMRRYQDLIEHCISPEISTLIQDYQAGSPTPEEYDVLNMLNTKYLLAGTTVESVFLNDAALGNAWFVEEVVKVNSPDEEIAKTCEIDTETTAVVDINKFPLKESAFTASGNINLVEYAPNYLKYEAQNAGAGLAVFSEIYYAEGWKAFIDDQEVPILRANYVLRALEIPEGNHTIAFRFEPQSYAIGNSAMMASSILIILGFIGSVGMALRKKEVAV